MLNHKKIGFTLAEVLITLTIIGVIAAITIPNLMQAWKKHEVEVKLKEAYSILNNALNMAKSEHGSWDSIIETAYSDYNNAPNYFAENYLKPYLKYNEYCERLTKNNKCNAFNYSTFVLDMNGTEISSAYLNHELWARFVLANGMYLGVVQHIPYNNNTNGSNAINFIVDINGGKGPNRNGYDVFFFGIFRAGTGSGCPDGYYCNKGNLLVASAREYQSTSIGATCSNTTYGMGCGAAIMRNGWKIPDDYPIKKW